MKFREKTREIEALQYTGNREACMDFLPVGSFSFTYTNMLTVNTEHSVAVAGMGDWVIKDRGHLKVIKGEDFVDIYERVDS